MKKLIAALLALCAMLTLAACSGDNESQSKATPLSVLSVSPDGADAPVSGQIVITFSKPIATATGEWVNLDNANLTDAVWSEGDTIITFPYSGLEHATGHELALFHFTARDGDLLDYDAYSFTTAAEQ